MILYHDEETLRSYRLHAFKYERTLKARVVENIRARGGDSLPIEERILSSIEKAMIDVGLIDEDLHAIPRNWAGKNLFEKACAVGWEAQYLSIFSGMSNAVHGSWTDLMMHHVVKNDSGGFRGVFEWTEPRPQQLQACAAIICQVADEIFAFYDQSEAYNFFARRIADMRERLRDASAAHEAFLQSPG